MVHRSDGELGRFPVVGEPAVLHDFIINGDGDLDVIGRLGETRAGDVTDPPEHNGSNRDALVTALDSGSLALLS